MGAFEAVDVLLRPAVCNLTFMGIKPPGCYGTVREEEHQGYGSCEGNEAKYDE
jgi:hypothetical protein